MFEFCNVAVVADDEGGTCGLFLLAELTRCALVQRPVSAGLRATGAHLLVAITAMVASYIASLPASNSSGTSTTNTRGAGSLRFAAAPPGGYPLVHERP